MTASQTRFITDAERERDALRELNVFLIGCHQPATLRVEGTSVEEITANAIRHRYLSGSLLSSDAIEPPTAVTIPVGRIQMIVEVCL